MLRQQIGPDERIHGAIMQAPTVTNAIPELTRTKYTIRSRTQKGARALGERVRKCLDAGALATGCKVELEETQMYADLVVVPPLCEGYQDAIRDLGVHVVSCDDTLMPGSTDQGNVSQVVPALHALVGIPVTDGAHNHTRQFTAAAAMDEAHERSVTSGKAMAMTGWRLLLDDQYYSKVRQSFDEIMG
jgi:metal-dependent amidase/aminoacylase/carboxypeptidase family protein